MSSTLTLALEITALNSASAVLNKVNSDTSNLAKRADDVKKHFAAAWVELAKGAAILNFGLGLNIQHPTLAGLVKPASDLEEAMLNVRSNIGNSSMAASELNKQLKDVANTSDIIANKTRISKVSATNIQNELFKGGLSQEDVSGERGAGVAVATMATLSGMPAETAATSVVNIGSMFGLQKEQYGELADTLVRVDDAAATSIPKLIYGLQGAGFNARALGEDAKSAAITLAMLSPLGEMAGTALNRMMSNTIGKTPKARRAMLELGLATEQAGKFNSKFYENGKFIGLARGLDMIRASLKSVHHEGERIHLADEIFGEEGGRAALAALLAGKGYKEIAAAAEDSYSSTKKLEIIMGGMNAQTDRFKNSWSSLMAEVFEPLNSTLSEMLKKMADGANKLQKFTASSDATKNIASGAAALAGTAVVGYGVMKYGSAGMSALKGLGGVASGVAQGKAVQAASGVTPVFVTNFSQMQGGGGAANTLKDLATTAAGTALPTLLKSAATGAMLLVSTTLPGIASLGVGAIASAGAMVAAAGAVGYGVGAALESLGSWATEGTAMEGWMTDHLGAAMAHVAAAFGSEDAQNAININLQLDGQQIAAVTNAQNARESRRN